MPRFSRGVRPEAWRDLHRLVAACTGERRLEVQRAANRLLDELAVDPHTKGVPCPQAWNLALRYLQEGPVRMFYWVRPLEDLYAEAIGFSLG
jgi:hypothetical protein